MVIRKNERREYYIIARPFCDRETGERGYMVVNSMLDFSEFLNEAMTFELKSEAQNALKLLQHNYPNMRHTEVVKVFD